MEVDRTFMASRNSIFVKLKTIKNEKIIQVSNMVMADAPFSPTGAAYILTTAMTQTYSKGSVRLASTNPDDQPIIQQHLLSENNDMDRMLEALNFARQLSKTEPLSGILGKEIMPGESVNTTEALTEFLFAKINGHGHPMSTTPWEQRIVNKLW